MRHLLVLPAACLALAVTPTPVHAAPTASVLGIPCATQADGVQACIGDTAHRVPTWDGVPLDVDVYLPPAAQSGPFPTIFFLHGFGQSKSGAVEAWARRGYALVQYSARGFGNSCGLAVSRDDPACVKGWAHMGDIRYEARDTQYLAGLLADLRIAEPRKIGVSGTSYGAGQSLELATLKDRMALPDGRLVRWTSPKGKAMAIAASAPNWAWSDLAGMLIPNGRTLDYLADSSYGRIGTPLASYVGLLFVAGGGLGYFPPPGADAASDADSWVVRFMAGDPYDDALSTSIVSEIRRYHSPLGIEVGLPEAARERPAPVFDNTAWNDDLTRTTEIIRWRNAVLARYPRAEVDLLFSYGAGHPRANGTTPGLEQRQLSFFDRLLKGAGGSIPGVRTYTQSCAGTRAAGPFDTATWAAQHPGEVRLRADAPARTITGAAPDQYALRVDPIAGSGCVSVPAEDSPLAATYRFAPAPARGYTLMGAPTVAARIATSSPWAQVDARLWDVAPDGNQTFVARVAYRPRANDSVPQVFQLQAAGWTFAAGHVPKLELLGQDVPYVRQSNTPFTATISGLRLRLPVRDRPGGVVRTPARPLDRQGRPIRRCSRVLAADLRAHCPTGRAKHEA